MSRIVQIINSIISSCTYIIYNDAKKEIWLVDCGDVKPIINNISKGYSLRGVLLTHTHYDHCYGLNSLLDYYPTIKVYTNSFGLKALQSPKLNLSRYHEDIPCFVINEISSIEDFSKIAGLGLTIIPTPGHDPSCLSFIIDKFLFTGDSYIPGYKVITTFPNSNRRDAFMSIDIIKKYEADGYIICPGHFVKKS